MRFQNGPTFGGAILLCLCFALQMDAATAENNPAGSTTATRPNILVIYADDQSYKTLSCYPEAPAWVKTPHIDTLAKSGVRFERAYLGAWCMPSRASFLTGRFQHAVQSMTMEGSYPGSTYDPAQCPFVPSQFRKSGYQTAQIGKWHTGVDSGYGRDWDYQVVWNRPAHPENAGNYYYNQTLTTNGKDGTSPEYVLLRDEKYKYIRTFVENEIEEIYDLDADPEELVNLATMVTNRSLLVRLRTTALEELRKTDAKCVDRLPKTRAERDSAAMLKPKSYVSHLAETKGPHIYWIDVEDRVGKVDVFQASHHGLDQSNNPVLIQSIEPRVAIINNGTKKGCMPMMFSELKQTSSIQAVYQMHKNLRDDGSVNNVADEYIANQLVECKGEHIQLARPPL